MRFLFINCSLNCERARKQKSNELNKNFWCGAFVFFLPIAKEIRIGFRRLSSETFRVYHDQRLHTGLTQKIHSYSAGQYDFTHTSRPSRGYLPTMYFIVTINRPTTPSLIVCILDVGRPSGGRPWRPAVTSCVRRHCWEGSLTDNSRVNLS